MPAARRSLQTGGEAKSLAPGRNFYCGSEVQFSYYEIFQVSTRYCSNHSFYTWWTVSCHGRGNGSIFISRQQG